MINGLNVEKITETVEVIQDNESLRDVHVQAKSIWKSGGLSETYVRRGSDEQAIKVCSDMLPLQGAPDLSSKCGAACPTELVLAALSSCLMIGITCHASLRGIHIQSLEIETKGKFDIGGFLGMNAKRNGYENLKLICNIDADASEAELSEIFEHVKSTSPILDVIVNKLDNVSTNLHASQR